MCEASSILAASPNDEVPVVSGPKFPATAIAVLACTTLAACQSSPAPLAAARPAAVPATFAVDDRDLPEPLVVIAYGDMRFTDPAETGATSPPVRRALVEKVAGEAPAAVFINGDLPWHGTPADYAVFHAETKRWRDLNLRIYPALGNHEFSQCEPADCLHYWWSEFPTLQGRRWYSVALGSRVLALALDSDASLLPGSEQRVWLEGQIGGLASTVRYVLVVLHHPPVADLATGELASHNPRGNEVALAEYLGRVAPQAHAAFLVSAGHTHNYERFLQDGVQYLVSGGGGAHPYPVERGPLDLYRDADFPNYHYVRVTVRADRLDAEMIRLADPAAAAPKTWEVRDRFSLQPPP